MVISSPYSNKDKAKTENRSPVDGDGTVILHNTSIDVDVSVRISELIKRISYLEKKVLSLEKKLGVYTTENQEPDAVDPPFIFGIWKFDIDGNDLILYVDYNLGLSVRDWVEKQRFTISESYP